MKTKVTTTTTTRTATISTNEMKNLTCRYPEGQGVVIKDQLMFYNGPMLPCFLESRSRYVSLTSRVD